MLIYADFALTGCARSPLLRAPLLAGELGQSREGPEPVAGKFVQTPEEQQDSLVFHHFDKGCWLVSEEALESSYCSEIVQHLGQMPKQWLPSRWAAFIIYMSIQSLGLRGGFFHRFSFMLQISSCCCPAAVCTCATSPAVLHMYRLSPAFFSLLFLLPSLLLSCGSQRPPGAPRLLLDRHGARGSTAGRTLRGRICMFTAQRIKGPCSYHCRTEYYKSSLRIPNPRAARPLFGNIKKLGDRNNQFPNDTLSNKTFLILSLPSPFSLLLPQLDNLT